MAFCEAWASPPESLHWPKEECGGSYWGESWEVPRVLRSQGVARGILWGVERGWVVRPACRALLSSFSAQDASIDEGGAPWS